MRLVDISDMERVYKFKGKNADDVEASAVYENLKNLPTVDAVPVVHAHWLHYPEIRDPGSAKRVMCSSCRSWAIGYPEIEDYAYCPNCGAKMEHRWRSR